jgi:NADPH-dependent 2,4-dienoyl-CoA reductase/sulfur reductase-like enzyme
VIRDWLPEHRDVVVLGAGLVGVKTAAHLAISGFPARLVEMADHILPNQLTREAARPIEAHLRSLGVEIQTRTTVDATRAGEAGDLEGVRIAGEWVACNTLLVGIGSTPDLEFLESTGLLDDGELVVSSALRTRDEHVFAAGDAVAIRAPDGARYYPWTWPQAVSQGKLAGANVYRASPVPLNTMTRPNATNVAGLPLVVLGAPSAGVEVVSRAGLRAGVRRELFLRGGCVVGGALVGDISGAGPLRAMMAARREVRGDILDLLEPRTRAFPKDAWTRLAQSRRARSITAIGSRA